MGNEGLDPSCFLFRSFPPFAGYCDDGIVARGERGMLNKSPPWTLKIFKQWHIPHICPLFHLAYPDILYISHTHTHTHTHTHIYIYELFIYTNTHALHLPSGNHVETGASLIVSRAWAGRPEASYTNHHIKSVIQPAAVRRGGIFKQILHFHMHADLLLLFTNHITVRLTDPNQRV